jgi:hypothetical protein
MKKLKKILNESDLSDDSSDSSLEKHEDKNSTKSKKQKTPLNTSSSDTDDETCKKENIAENINDTDDDSNNEYKNNGKIWIHILKYINYDCKKDREISADDIKNAKKTWKGKSSQFEPRLLCKQDTKDERPGIFKKNNLCMLSIKNGTYLITKENIYIDLEYPDVKHKSINKNSKSLLLKLGNSESTLIDNLRYSGIFEQKKYLDEKINFGPLLNGRHRCSFKAILGNTKIEAKGVQFETDACYESDNKILIIECKGKPEKNFNIRQLYCPYRYIYDSVKDKKEIIPLFITKDKDNFIHIWKYKFEDPQKMMSIKKIDYNKYKFID